MTTLSATERWLDGRLDGAPPELARDVRALIRGTGDDARDEHADAIADLLARAGLAGLDEIVQGGGGRETALRLLAADAALTLAFEAAAELGGDVSLLCRRIGPSGELGLRFDRESRTGGDR